MSSEQKSTGSAARQRSCTLTLVQSGGEGLTGEVGIIHLHIPHTRRIQDLELLLISLGDILEIRIVVLVHARQVGLSGTVPEVVPRRTGEGELDLAPLRSGDEGLKVGEFGEDGGAARVRDGGNG